MVMTRRTMLKAGVTTLSAAVASPALLASAVSESGQSRRQPAAAAGVVNGAAEGAVSGAATKFEAFRERGYYITFMRAPLFSFETWKEIFNALHDDGVNLILLWMGGAFRSRKFPVTWKYNAEHKNVQHDFAGRLIDYAHSLGIRVLLCLTPFGYDGVNQYALEHPSLKAIAKDGNYTAAFGLGAWGFNLNPYRAESQQFMLEYTRELLDFYPNADGLLLESSDYAISYCGDCPETYYEAEFRFVKQISTELWARRSDALIVVYPHYFAGTEVPGMGIHAARERFDPRWGLFFTPHSAPVDPALVKQARSVLYWDSSPTLGGPGRIQSAAKKAQAAGATGFVPSFEPWNYVLQGPDGGDQFLVGHRLSPFGFGWLEAGASPVKELLMRVNRLAYREFSRNPALEFEEYRKSLSEQLFAGRASTSLLDDLLFLEESFFLDRTWISVSAIASPQYVKGMLDLGRIAPARLKDYRARRQRLAQMAARYADASDVSTKEIGQIAAWIVGQWQASPAHRLVDAHLD